MADKATTPKFMSVAVPVPFRQTFQYELPAGATVTPGMRVRVPFGRRSACGVVVSLDASAEIDKSRIKPPTALLNPAIQVDDIIMRLCLWAADYYVHPVGEVFATALPTLIRIGKEPQAAAQELAATNHGMTLDLATLGRALTQRRVLEQLRAGPRTRQELKELEASNAVVNQLVTKELAEWRTPPSPAPTPFRLAGVNTGNITPNDQQRTAIEQVAGSGTHLLHGVTGSGKTEVYLRLIERCLKAGRQALVLVPEIGLTPQTVRRFKDRFNVPVAEYHSRLTDRERADVWIRASRGEVGIVLGTRSAVYVPLAATGIIVVDEEHDSSYKQHEGFHYSARDLAVYRGRLEDVPVLLGSATPSLESLHNATTGKYAHLELTERAAKAATETYTAIDIEHMKLNAGFSEPLITRIRQVVERGQQVLVFLNRRGFAPVLLCNECGWVANCSRCDAKVTYHIGNPMLICHHCGSQMRPPSRCQACESVDLAVLGQGTQRVEQTLKGLFPDTPVLRVDRDSTRAKGALANLFREVDSGDAAILVGTQLLAKGHHFPGVTLVAVLDMDSGFFSADYRALERTGQTLLQVGGRSGRAEAPGEVIVQTRFAKHPLFLSLTRDGYASFAEELLAQRHAAGLPPYAYHALIRASSLDKDSARRFLAEVGGGEPSAGVELLGPVPALMERRAGRYRQQLLLSSTSRQRLHKALHERVARASELSLASKVRWSVDVDPYDLM